MGDLEDLGFYSSINNFDNEVEILQSRTLIKKVVEELDLYISYATKSSFHDIELYKSSPVKVWITPEEAQKLPAPARLHLTLQPGNKLNVKLRIGEEEYNKQFDKLPALLTTPSGTFSFTPKDSTTVQSTQEIMATVSSPRSVANAYRGALSIEPTSKSTTIAQISVKSTHTQRGMDFINKLVEVYNRDANDDKNEVATKTAEFIDERIKIINGELGTTEQELETFKRDAGLTDLKSDAQLALSENSEYEKETCRKQHPAPAGTIPGRLCQQSGSCLRSTSGQCGPDRYRSCRADQPLQRDAAGTQAPAPFLPGKQPGGSQSGCQHPRHAQQCADHHQQRTKRFGHHPGGSGTPGRQIRRTHHQCSGTGTPAGQHLAPAGNQKPVFT